MNGKIVNIGFRAVEFNCIVQEDKVNDKVGSIYIPDQTKEIDQHAMTTGTLMSVAPTAFTYELWPQDRVHEIPKIGDKVLYAKYAGTVVKSKDGIEYRVIKDKDILAVIED